MLYGHFEQRYTKAWRCGNQIVFSNEKDMIMKGYYVALLTAELRGHLAFFIAFLHS